MATKGIVPPRLSMSGISKAFGSTIALDDVSLNVGPGEALALIGENGAGKSTLMKVLAGALAPDRGQVEIDGVATPLDSPLAARRAGIALIYQELNLAPDLTVEANILLGMERSRFGWLDRRTMRAQAQDALRQLSHDDIPLDARAGDLSIGEQQLVEIARALTHQPKVLALDEPTSSLTAKDTERLFQALRRLKEDGVSLIYISHFLEELGEVCGQFTVLRDGKTALSGSMADASMDAIVNAMVGRDLEDIYARSPRVLADVALEVRELSGRVKPSGVTFQVRKGEVFGIAGLIGAGRTETLRSVFGLDPVSHGEVSIGGTPDRGKPTWERIKEGVGMLSEDRKVEGLALDRSLADNLCMSAWSQVASKGWVRSKRQLGTSNEWVEKLSVKAENAARPIQELSGGNQQKVAIGRLLFQGAQVLLLDEPTRGIDVGSKAQIYHWIDRAACEGAAVLFVSSYLPELLGVCDTIGVMARGSMVAIRPVEEWTEALLVEAALGLGESERRT